MRNSFVDRRSSLSAAARGAAPCAPAPPPATVERTPLSALGRRRCSRTQAYDAALVAAVRRSGARSSSRTRRSTPIATCDRRWRGSIRRARSSTRIAGDRYPTVTAGASVDVREQAQPGFRDEPLRINTYRAGFDASWELDLFGRVRAAVAAARGQRRELRGGARRRARQRRRGGGAQLLRAARHAAAAVGARAEPGQPARDAAADRGAARRRHRRGTGRRQRRRRACRRSRRSVPPLRTALARARASARGADRPGAGAADASIWRRAPTRCSAKAIALGPPDQLLDRRPDVRAAERRLAATAAREGVAAADLYPRITISGLLGLLAGRGSMFGTSDSRAWAVTPALQWGAFDLGSARARLRGAHAATEEALAELRADGAAGAGGDRDRARDLSAAAGAAGQADRRGARERPGGGHRARSAIAKASPSFSRCSTPSARSCRPRAAPPRPKPRSSPPSSVSTARWEG